MASLCRPVLRCLGLGAFLKHHVHQSGDNLLTLAGFGGGLVLQAEDTEHDVIKKLCQSLQITLARVLAFFSLGGVDKAYRVEDVRQCDRRVEVIAKRRIDSHRKWP